jgi:hypothetical protein
VLNKSGVAAFLNDIDGVHNKSLAFTVGVVVCDIVTGVISGLRDGTAFAVCVTLGVAVTVGVSVLPALAAAEEDAICFCFSLIDCCIVDCMLDFRFATFAIYMLCSI